MNYAQEGHITSIIRQLSELIVTVALLGFAWSINSLPVGERSGELVGGIIGSVTIYWISKSTSSATQRGLQEVTARALNGPLSAVAETNAHQSNKVDNVVQELSSLKVLIAGLQQQYGRRASDDRDAIVASTARASHAEGRLEVITEGPLDVNVVNPADAPVPVATIKLVPPTATAKAPATNTATR